MSRASVALVAALLLAPLARAQQPGAVEPTTLLPRLRERVDAARSAYVAAVERRVHAQDAYSTYREKKLSLLEKEREKLAEPAGLFRDRELGAIKTQLAALTADAPKLITARENALGDEAVRRFAFVRSLEALVERLMIKADEARVNDRGRDVQMHTEEALQHMREVDQHWPKIEVPPELDLPRIDPRTMPDERLARDIDLYTEYREAAERRVRELTPDKEALERRANRVADLIKRGYAAADLPQRHERAREQFGRIAGLVEREKKRVDDYRQRIEAMEKERANRAIRRGATGPEVPR